MANIINQVTAASGAGNTGAPRSVIEEGIPVGVMLVPPGPLLDNDDLQSPTTALEALQAKTWAAQSARIFPIGPFANIETQDTDATVEETALGYRRTIRRGKIGRRFEIWAGGPVYHQSVFAFDGTDKKAVLIDDKNNIIGTYVENAQGQKEFYGLSLSDFAVSNYGSPDGSVGAKFFITLQFAVDAELNTAKAVVNLGVPVLSYVTGLNDVHLEDDDSATSATDTVRIAITSDKGATSAEDFYAIYETALSQSGAWDVRNASTDAAVVVASVAGNDSRGSWTLTLTTPPASVKVTLKSTTVLNGLTTPAAGIEADNTITIDVP